MIKAAIDVLHVLVGTLVVMQVHFGTRNSETNPENQGIAVLLVGCLAVALRYFLRKETCHRIRTA